MKRIIKLIILVILGFMQVSLFAGNPYKTAISYIDTCKKSKIYLLGNEDSVYRYHIRDSISKYPSWLNIKEYVMLKYSVKSDSIDKMKREERKSIYRQLADPRNIYKTQEIENLIQSIDTNNYNVNVIFSDIEKVDSGIIISVYLEEKVKRVYNVYSPSNKVALLFLISKDGEKILKVLNHNINEL